MKEKRQNNSKKFMAIIAIVIMMGLIIGMGAITYSKYVTSNGAGTQTATAAKWGYVINVDTKDLFGESYGNASSSLATVTANGVAVEASSNANVVAPGTTGSMTITISGSAEVKAELKIVVDGIKEITLGDYSPVKWTLNDGTKNVVEDVTLTALKEALAKNESITANTEKNDTYTISWKWDFNNTSDNGNVKDTAIGYSAAGKAYADLKTDITSVVTKEEYEAISKEIAFSLSVSIEQVLE